MEESDPNLLEDFQKSLLYYARRICKNVQEHDPNLEDTAYSLQTIIDLIDRHTKDKSKDG